MPLDEDTLILSWQLGFWASVVNSGISFAFLFMASFCSACFLQGKHVLVAYNMKATTRSCSTRYWQKAIAFSEGRRFSLVFYTSCSADGVSFM